MRFSRREMYDWGDAHAGKKENLETVLVSVQLVFFARLGDAHAGKKSLKPYWFQGFLRPAFAACSAELLHLPPQTGDDALSRRGDVRLGDAHAGKKKTLKPYWFQGFLCPHGRAVAFGLLCRLFS